MRRARSRRPRKRAPHYSFAVALERHVACSREVRLRDAERHWRPAGRLEFLPR